MSPLSATGRKLLSKIAYGGLRVTRSLEIARWSEGYGFGTATKRDLVFTDEDAKHVGIILGREYGIFVDISDMIGSRGDLARMMDDEKGAGNAASVPQVRYRSLPGRSVRIAGEDVRLPEGHSLTADPESLVRDCEAGSVLVIENRWTFDNLSRYRIRLAEDHESPIVLWRGSYDKGEGGTGAFHAAIRRLAVTRPVDSFPDLDPAGLGISAGYPSLRRIRLPDIAKLQHLRDRTRNEKDYINQLPRNAPMLTACDHPDIAIWWAFLREIKSRIPQESMTYGA